MDTKQTNKIIAIVVIFFTCVQSTCKKNSNCVDTKYSFEIGVKALPNLDSVNINDTIWLLIDEPVNLLDKISNSTIDYSNASNLGSAIGFQKVIFTPSLNFIPAIDKFNFKLIEGQETNNSNPLLYRNYLFAENNNRYTFKLGVIPKESGVFSFVFSNASNVYRKNNNCTKAFFEINFKETNQHRYLIPGYGGNTVKGGDYYFKVK